MSRHANEIALVWRAPSGTELPTTDLDTVRREAMALTSDHRVALAVQIERQRAALSSSRPEGRASSEETT